MHFSTGVAFFKHFLLRLIPHPINQEEYKVGAHHGRSSRKKIEYTVQHKLRNRLFTSNPGNSQSESRISEQKPV